MFGDFPLWPVLFELHISKNLTKNNFNLSTCGYDKPVAYVGHKANGK